VLEEADGLIKQDKPKRALDLVRSVLRIVSEHQPPHAKKNRTGYQRTTAADNHAIVESAAPSAQTFCRLRSLVTLQAKISEQPRYRSKVERGIPSLFS